MRNWEVQREPADVRIYWRAAEAAGRQEDLRRVKDWIQQTHYEDAVLGLAAEPAAGPPTMAKQ